MSIQSSPVTRGDRPDQMIHNDQMKGHSENDQAMSLPSTRTGYSSDAKLLLHKGKKHALEGPRRLAQLHQTLKSNGT